MRLNNTYAGCEFFFFSFLTTTAIRFYVIRILNYFIFLAGLLVFCFGFGLQVYNIYVKYILVIFVSYILLKVKHFVSEKQLCSLLKCTLALFSAFNYFVKSILEFSSAFLSEMIAKNSSTGLNFHI